MSELSEVRIDKFLWAVRLYKTRTAAAEACRGGHVVIDQQNAKPARPVRVGDVIRARTGLLMRTVKVTGLADRRVGPKLVGNFLEDQTPASEYLKAEEARAAAGPVRPKGLGRPTKKDRRELERMLE
jgi:ribosome-associated heat shock protein Hsp15